MRQVRRQKMPKKAQSRFVTKWVGGTETGVRWSARIIGTALAVLLFLQAVGHPVNTDGLYNPFIEPAHVTLRLVGLFATFAGAILAWKWEAIGGVLIVVGLLPYNVSEGKVWFGGWVGLLQLAAIGFIVCWFLRKLAATGRSTGRVARSHCVKP
jgi:hypothetical protein